MKTPFLGPYNVSRSRNFADNLLINLFPEISETKDGKGPGVLYMTPGLDLLATCGTGPIRGTAILAGLLYVVSGVNVYSVSTSYAVTFIGRINTATGPVSIIENGTQMAIFDGVNGYLVRSTGSMAPTMITLPFSGPVSATYQDGFGLVNQLGTNQWWQSNLFDLSIWDALNFSSADSKPDSIIAMKSIHREVWLIKQNESEIWINAGLPGFAFQRLEGVYPEIGIAAVASVAKAQESLIWLSRTSQGQGIVVMTQGYQTRRISDHAVEYAIAQLPTMSDAVAFCYQQEGHEFYVLTFPTGNVSFCYDVATSALTGIPMWHKRAAFSNGQFSRWWPTTHTVFNGLNVVGDYRNGNLYALDLNTQTDNGTQRKWVRSWRAVAEPSMRPRRFNCLTIDMMTGVGVPAGTNPLVALNWSDDDGNNWSEERPAPVGQPGQTALRVQFKRLGSTKRDRGLDRIFRLSSSDLFTVALIGADLI